MKGEGESTSRGLPSPRSGRGARGEGRLPMTEYYFLPKIHYLREQVIPAGFHLDTPIPRKQEITQTPPSPSPFPYVSGLYTP